MLDELGSTSCHDKAFPYMWALCEKLLGFRKTLSLIATHNSRLRLFCSAMYSQTGIITLSKFSISDEDSLPDTYKERQVFLEDLDPSLFSDQDFYETLMENKSEI